MKEGERSGAEQEMAAHSETTRSGLLAEFWGFVCENKKWWLVPIVLALLFFGLLIFLGGTPVGPFIYSFF